MNILIIENELCFSYFPINNENAYVYLHFTTPNEVLVYSNTPCNERFSSVPNLNALLPCYASMASSVDRLDSKLFDVSLDLNSLTIRFE